MIDTGAIIWLFLALFNTFVVLPVVSKNEIYVSYGWDNPIIAPITTIIMVYYVIIKSVQQSIQIINGKYNNDR